MASFSLRALTAWLLTTSMALVPASGAASRSGDGGDDRLELLSLADTDPLAVCNDGTPGGLYYAAGADSDAAPDSGSDSGGSDSDAAPDSGSDSGGFEVWLLYLAGGHWC